MNGLCTPDCTVFAHAAGQGHRLVRQYLAAPSFPVRAPNRPRRTLLTPYEPDLYMHWEAGYQYTAALWRELSAQGFIGSGPGPPTISRKREESLW